MATAMTLKVTPDGGEPYVVEVSMRDVLTWERTTKGNKKFTDLLNDPELSDLYRVAHLASWRQQLFHGKLDEFEKSCEIEGVPDAEDDDDPDPTRSGPSPESSSSSPSSQGSRSASGRKRTTEQS